MIGMVMFKNKAHLFYNFFHGFEGRVAFFDKDPNHLAILTNNEVGISDSIQDLFVLLQQDMINFAKMIMKIAIISSRHDWGEFDYLRVSNFVFD